MTTVDVAPPKTARRRREEPLRLDPAARKAALFPNFTKMPRRISISRWRWLRLAVFIVGLAEVGLLFASPDLGLDLFWGAAVPVLPLLFLVAPGVWRNICPLAAANQTPRLFNFSRANQAPKWLVENGFLIGVALFFVLVPTRKAILNDNGPVLGLLLLVLLAAAFTGGVFLKGKAGWCSTMCPLLPVQRLYGQNALMTSPNSHCDPCVGCAKNCFDFNPHVAYLADQYDDDATFRTRRRFFAGSFPGLVVSFFTVPDDFSNLEMYGFVALGVVISLGVFYGLDALLRTPAGALPAVFGALAFTLFYALVIPATVERWGGDISDWTAIIFGAAVLPLSGPWLIRTLRKERTFVEIAAERKAVRVAAPALAARKGAAPEGPEVTFVDPESGKEHRALAEDNKPLLDLIEKGGLPIEAGCRMGVCGSDPVAVVDGMDNLTPISDDEAGTLGRLGYGPNTRMACQARVKGACVVKLQPDTDGAGTEGPVEAPFEIDTSVRRIVVLGNGIAGVTTADHIRRLHGDCQVDLVGREPHHLYNRMAISRLIYGRSAMSGLYLQTDNWYEKHRITTWLNTRATAIDLDNKTVTLGTGENLDWDRLILATGSSSRMLPIPGFDKDGVFVLRDASDAMNIRAWVQETGGQHAVVAGGGVLGIEAAYALSKLGLQVTVLEVESWPLRRQLDARSGQLLRTYLHELGIETIVEARTSEATGDRRIEAINLEDGREVPADVLLVAAGIVPNIELAATAGLDVGYGVVVDDTMRTSHPDVLAAGDVAECGGRVAGLWPSAVKQAEVAARNAVGDNTTFAPPPPKVLLKVVGIDLMSIGRVEHDDDDDEIVLEDSGQLRYRKLVIDPDGRLVGSIMLGYAEEATVVSDAVMNHRAVATDMDALRAGDWSALIAPG